MSEAREVIAALDVRHFGPAILRSIPSISFGDLLFLCESLAVEFRQMGWRSFSNLRFCEGKEQSKEYSAYDARVTLRRDLQLFNPRTGRWYWAGFDLEVNSNSVSGYDG